ncbi:MAG: aminotransferase class I/II-fold pyridoxal phosphate-dependent enzyme [Bauldia sp.]|nr:aminotransferase class I/II-fold pyridoxal phosphate-dependent enzyme [Bauldia sp.]
MPSERIPLAVPDLSGNEARYLQECIATGMVSSVGPFVTRFEEGVAAAVGAARAVATSSGTTALHLGLVALGVRRGDLVLSPSFTFIATANAIAHAGAMPWLIDIDPASWTVDPAALAAALDRDAVPGPDGPVHRPSGRRIGAVLPVHTLGATADIDAIVAIADRHGLPVLADAACAIGVFYRGRPISAGVGLSALSFNGNKTITSGGGGMLVGDDLVLVERARHLSTTARVGRDYDHDAVGYNYRMTNIEAAVGLAQIERLDELVARKRVIRARYDAAFAAVDWLTPFPQPQWSESTCWLSGVVVAPSAPVAAAEIIDRLQKDNIDARPFWKPVHLQRPYAAAPCEPLPVTDDLWNRIVTLPSSAALAATDQDRVIRLVLAAAGR